MFLLFLKMLEKLNLKFMKKKMSVSVTSKLLTNLNHVHSSFNNTDIFLTSYYINRFVGECYKSESFILGLQKIINKAKLENVTYQWLLWFYNLEISTCDTYMCLIFKATSLHILVRFQLGQSCFSLTGLKLNLKNQNEPRYYRTNLHLFCAVKTFGALE